MEISRSSRISKKLDTVAGRHTNSGGTIRPLGEKLMELTGRKVDLVPEHELNRHLRDAILKEAKNL